MLRRPRREELHNTYPEDFYPADPPHYEHAAFGIPNHVRGLVAKDVLPPPHCMDHGLLKITVPDISVAEHQSAAVGGDEGGVEPGEDDDRLETEELLVGEPAEGEIETVLPGFGQNHVCLLRLVVFNRLPVCFN